MANWLLLDVSARFKLRKPEKKKYPNQKAARRRRSLMREGW